MVGGPAFAYCRTVGLTLAFFIARSVTVLSLGDDLAKGLGQYTSAVKLVGMLIVVILTGYAVSIAGTIAFIGLIIPHITRFWSVWIIGGSFLARRCSVLFCLFC